MELSQPLPGTEIGRGVYHGAEVVKSSTPVNLTELLPERRFQDLARRMHRQTQLQQGEFARQQ